MSNFLRVWVFVGVLGLLGCPESGPSPDTNIPAQPDVSSPCEGDDCGCSETGCEVGVCHPELNRCVNCVEDAECGSAFCHPEAFACVQCLRDAQCPTGVCTAEFKCVQCTADTHCAGGKTCDLTKNICLGDCVLDKECKNDNPCTSATCDDGTCRTEPKKDGTTCDDKDACTEGDMCLEGACMSGPKKSDDCCVEPTCSFFSKPADLDGDNCKETCVCKNGEPVGENGNCLCTDEPKCPVGSKGKDLDKDGCVDSCFCADGAEVKPGGTCPCKGVIVCPAGSQPQDTTKDGCPDTCACTSDDCIKCKIDTDCVDKDPCTIEGCSFGVCETKPVKNCCVDTCDCYADGNKPDDVCLTDGATETKKQVPYFLCQKNKCTSICGELPVEASACICKDTSCAVGLNGTDTTGDGCLDTCLCPDGSAPNEENQCNVCDPIFCAPGQIGIDQSGDGCVETCACPDGTPVEGLAFCPCFDESACSIFSKAVDANQDGCVDWCTCKSGALVKAGEACPCLKEILCEPGFSPVDYDLDGCADACVCTQDDCVTCKVDQDCDDDDTCTSEMCDQGLCLFKKAADCCKALSCPKGAAEKDTDGDGCPDTCVCKNGMKPNADSCNCALEIFCKDGYELVDTTGDGCPDECKWPCTSTCDCYVQGDPKPCVDAQDGEGGFYSCEKGLCDSFCGVLTDEHYGCLGCPNAPPKCAKDLKPADTTGDGCLDTCVCEDGSKPVNGLCGCKPVTCFAGQKSIDTNADGCADTCVTECKGVCDCTAAGTLPQGLCSADACEGCSAQWTCDGGICQAVCSDSNEWAQCTEIKCKSVKDCPSQKYMCQMPEGAPCKGEGVCALKPTECEDVAESVCGCDAKLYKNSCFAFMAGVNVGKLGGCK